ncbi:LysR family transcriptional regulator [Acidimangrovimonas sediminis]|uniref:LysR family transcriptional regulator n=1 Tax=Acidimangrovimonas sediminis TaxID=2056283 RepID=UPI000C80906F|nr:LysR family transcriptional regulator [Acidimangrovimonas sediminis]
MAITFRQLRYFLALAEELHFGRAAERLHISQPPLSASLKQLEGEVGVALMERSNRMVRLTPAGAVFAEHARRILGQLGRAEASAVQAARGGGGRVVVAFVPSMLFRRLPPLLQSFAEAHPGVDLVLHEMNTTRQIEAIGRMQADVGFIHGVPLPEGIAHHPLETERLVCCLPQGHRLAGRSRVRLSELAGERLLVFSREFAAHYHDRIAGLLQSAGLTPDPDFRIQHWFTVVALVGQGMGVSLVPRSLAGAAFANVAYVEIEEEAAEHEVALIWREEGQSAAARAFVRFVIAGG